MFVESLEKLPEELRGDFVESEFNGKKGFQHKDTIALANSLKNAKAERDQYRTKATEYESQMSEALSLIHISEPTRRHHVSRMPSSA